MKQERWEQEQLDRHDVIMQMFDQVTADLDCTYAANGMDGKLNLKWCLDWKTTAYVRLKQYLTLPKRRQLVTWGLNFVNQLCTIDLE